MDDFNSSLQNVYTNVEAFLEPTKDLEKKLLTNSKDLYDFMQEIETNYVQKKNSLKELLINGFDNEQIWQELELQNNPCLKSFKSNFKNLSLVDNPFVEEVTFSEKKSKTSRISKRKKSNEVIDNKDLSMGEELLDDLEDNDMNPTKDKSYKQTVLDDNFFRLREMEEYLDTQDKLEELRRDNNETVEDDSEEDEKEEDIDLFNENMSDDEEKAVENIKYKDFFDPPNNNESKKKKSNKASMEMTESVEELLEDDLESLVEEEEGIEEEQSKQQSDQEMSEQENEENVDKKALSNFEKKQSELKNKIKRLEDANIAVKPWQLLGETNATKRPVNSLLEEHVTFDHTSVGAPVITEETTESLEDIIKQRIKDEAWDDVERKVKPVTQPYEYKKAPELNQEKSKLSLAEVYEKEYLKEQETEKVEKENVEHIKIQNLMDKLFVKLDALSNFQFTPKPPNPELKIISNVASLQMEEITPITMTESSQLAPEEIFDKKKGDVKGSTEKTETDRKHERREKKTKKKFAVKEKDRKEKLKIKAGKVVKSSKKKAMDQLKKGTRNTIVNEKTTSSKTVKSSSEFFNRLQDEAKTAINKQKNIVGKENRKKTKTTNAFKL